MAFGILLRVTLRSVPDQRYIIGSAAAATDTTEVSTSCPTHGQQKLTLQYSDLAFRPNPEDELRLTSRETRQDMN